MAREIIARNPYLASGKKLHDSFSKDGGMVFEAP
jgi:hypothetical protein